MTRLQQGTIDTFRGQFGGPVFEPADAGYNEARQIWNAMIDRKPELLSGGPGVLGGAGRGLGSARLLETYLGRRFGGSWRADDEADSEGAHAGGNGNAGGPLTENEALDILGLEPGASRDEIIKAHRRMMQKLHPDHGGSNYLAARINEAKECLLA